MPLAKDVVAIEDAFICLLKHLPGTKAEKQAYFNSRSIQVPRTNYESMWEALAGRLNRSGAGSAVFELLRIRIPLRAADLLHIARKGSPVELRDSDPAIVEDLFFLNGKLRRLGELFLEDLESRGVSIVRGPTETLAPASKSVPNSKPYEIALSFAEEDRKLVEEVAELLKSSGITVFYDKFEEVELWGKDLTAHLAEIYRDRANYCAMFISQHYVSKAWPRLERQHAQSRSLAQKREYPAHRDCERVRRRIVSSTVIDRPRRQVS